MKKFLSMFLISSSLVFADNNTIGLDTVVGATLGVAIGNQIGRGNGKDVARVAGGLLGAAIANNSRDSRNYSNYNNSPYNNGYERTTTYVRDDYYDDYYYDRRPPTEVVVIYDNFPRPYYYPGFYPPRHHHRDFHDFNHGHRR